MLRRSQRMDARVRLARGRALPLAWVLLPLALALAAACGSSDGDYQGGGRRLGPPPDDAAGASDVAEAGTAGD